MTISKIDRLLIYFLCDKTKLALTLYNSEALPRRIYEVGTLHWPLNVGPELVMGHFFKTQPNPKFLDPSQPNPLQYPPDPTQPIIDTWYGILGYTENFIQQLLHVTDKFYKPTVNESYYSAAVLISRQ